MDDLMDLRNIIARALREKYVRNDLPSQNDKDIIRCMKFIGMSDVDHVHNLSSKLSLTEARVLKLFAERMASLSVRRLNIDLIKHGLKALAISSPVEDVRESLVVSAVLRDAVIRINESPPIVRKEVEQLFSIKEVLNCFCSNAEEGDLLKEMGYSAHESKDGFVYRRLW